MNLQDAIYHGARQRLRPILMTAAATIFALIPMAMGLTGGGGFISQPLAVVVIGGLVSSTALTLVLVPVLYHLVEGAKERGAKRRADKRRKPGGPATSTSDLIKAMDEAGKVPVYGSSATAAETNSMGAVPPPVSATGAYPPGTLINPATGSIPLTRRERKEVEEGMHDQKPAANRKPGPKSKQKPAQ